MQNAFYLMGGKLSLSNRKEGRKREGTQTRRHPGSTRLEVFGKDAMKKGDRNHPNSMQNGNYIIENLKISEKNDRSPSAKRGNCATSYATV